MEKTDSARIRKACDEGRLTDALQLLCGPEPVGAAEMGFADGETVRVSTKKGSLTIPVETTWQTARGYCLIPHHMGLLYEGKVYGTHINLLTDHKDIDELTGNAKWRYTPCRVEAL